MIFRDACPEDGAAAVPLIYSSGPAFLDYIFCQDGSQQSLSFMRKAFTQGSGELGFRNHTVLEIDGAIIAAGACFDSSDNLSFSLAGMRQIIHFYGLSRGAQVIRRALAAGTVVPPPVKTQLYVGHLGVSPDFRGRGIGESLLKQLIRCKRREHRVAVLDVSVENPRAQQLYQRMGFEVTGELASTLHSPFATIAAHRRMEMPL